MFRVPEDEIHRLLGRSCDRGEWRDVLDRVTPDTPADPEDIALLIHACDSSPDAFERIITSAAEIRNEVHGRDVKLFVPVYISNVCVNECLYCAYRASNIKMPRRTLSVDELKREVAEVTGIGYRVIELVTGECPSLKTEGVIAEHVRAARDVISRADKAPEDGEVILMSWALNDDEFREVADAGLDAFYLWQETYSRDVYAQLHPGGTPKADFDWRVNVFDRAIRAGIRKVGLGVLLGLHDWRFEVLSLISHGRYLMDEYEVGPDVIGVPRFKHAEGAVLKDAPRAVSDDELRLTVALYRLAFPRSHVFLNTREKLGLMLRLLEGGGSEMNIACAVYPGGYTEPSRARQFDYYSYPTDKTLVMLTERGYRPTHFRLS